MKITKEIVAKLAEDARTLTAGAYGMMESSRPGRDPKITDVKAELVWAGPDYLRQAAAFYAGIIDLLTQSTPAAVLQVLTEVRLRHSAHVNDGRTAARDWSAARRTVGAGTR